MKLSEKQQQIIAHIKTSGTITKKHAVDMFKMCYYTNAEKYVGEILSNMVKRGLIKRVKAGVFELSTRKISIPSDSNQTSLL